MQVGIDGDDDRSNSHSGWEIPCLVDDPVESGRSVGEAVHTKVVAESYEQFADLLRQLDLDRIWKLANEQEQQTLLNELLVSVVVHPDNLEVVMHGAPPLHVQLSEAGLKDSQNGGVGGRTYIISPPTPIRGFFDLTACSASVG